MLTDIPIKKEAAKAHGAFFSEIHPACTFIIVIASFLGWKYITM